MHLLVPATVLDELTPTVAALSPEVRLLPYAEDDETPIPGADEAEAVFRWIAGKRYETFIAANPRIRWLHTASAGIDHVVTPALRERAEQGRLTITDSGPAFDICIGEFVLAWMLAVARRIPESLALQRGRVWKWITHEELYGRTVGIIGLGPLGRGIAARCRAMGMRTLGLRRRPEPAAEVDETLTGADGLTRLLTASDWVVVAAALTPETRHLLGPAELARMKPTARLINVARGPLVDEDALIAALRDGGIAGACLDVFAKEPLPADHPLWDMPNVYITSHNATGWTAGLRRRQLDLLVSNLRRYRAGEPLEGVVDVARGY
jgi:phosphoglycerate dehydrogenase-like enzyme